MQTPKHAGLRHLALNVRQLDEMKRFYTELLGFAVEWEPDSDNVYLSSGVDNLALHRSTPLTAGGATPLTAGGATPLMADHPTPLASRSTAPTAGHPAGEAQKTASNASPLDHLGLIVREADDVDRWATFLDSRGVTIDAKPRTHRDGARSCYFKDPDGNTVQIIHHPPISQKI